MCRPSSFVTCNLATIYIRWKEKKKKEEEKKKRTKNDGYNRRVNLLGKLGIIKNDNAIIDEFAIASRQATRRLKDRFEAIIFSLIRDYQKRELSGFMEKKKKNLTNPAIRDKVLQWGKTFCRGVVIMETYGRLDARGNIYDGNLRLIRTRILQERFLRFLDAI